MTIDKSTSIREWSSGIAASSPARAPLGESVRVRPPRALPRRALLGLMGAIGGTLATGVARSVFADCATGARNPIQGPYFLDDPEEKYDTGSGLVVTGTVLDAATCTPIPSATIVRWHANDLGFYEEFYRAIMRTKADGTFQMSTIPPGQYSNLARHIHWFVVAEGYQSVTAQTQWSDSETIAGTTVPWNFSLAKA